MYGLLPQFIGIAFGFFFVGVIFVLIAFYKLFIASARSTGIHRATDFPSVDSPDFLRALSHLTDFTQGNRGEIVTLKSGAEFLESFIRDIEGAKKSINITAYVWDKGKVTKKVSYLLAKKAKEGIPVRLLLDGFGGFGYHNEQLPRMRDAGVMVEHFRGIRPDKIRQLHRRNHRRAIVIDGEIGYTGGMAFSDYWFFDTKQWGPVWRDLMFRVRGEFLRGLQTSFAELWANTTGEILSGDTFYTDQSGALPEEKHVLQKANSEKSPFFHLSSSPSSDIHPFSRFLWYSVASAKEKAYITSPYFIPNKSFHTCLTEKAKAGVDVRLILPSKANMDQPFVRWAANSYYWDLLESGVRIFEYKPSMIHTKLVLVDDHWSIVGSGNIDFRSFEINEENAYGIQDKEFASHLHEIFQDDLENSKEILLHEWKKRGLWSKIRERFILLFAAQF